MSNAEDQHVVRVMPGDIALQCNKGETLIRCAWRHGYYWPTICGGHAECGACRCELVADVDKAEEMGLTEQEFFRGRPRTSRTGRLVRLACCMTVSGPLTVFKVGVKPR